MEFVDCEDGGIKNVVCELYADSFDSIEKATRFVSECNNTGLWPTEYREPHVQRAMADMPQNIEKATHLLHTVILTDTHCRATPHPHQSIPGMHTHTASMGTRGHRTHADLPRLYTHLCGGALDAGHRRVRCMPRSHETAAA